MRSNPGVLHDVFSLSVKALPSGEVFLAINTQQQDHHDMALRALYAAADDYVGVRAANIIDELLKS
jgi:hypothetical protein